MEWRGGTKQITQMIGRAVAFYHLRGTSTSIITYYSTTLVTKSVAWGKAWLATYVFP